MPSSSSIRILLRALLALLLAVNGIAPALAAGAMHHAAPTAVASADDVMAMGGTAPDCHDGATAPTAQDLPAADDATPAPCCEDGRCDGAGCDCACLALAAALPMPAPVALVAVLRARPAHPVPQAHAPPPPSGVTRPPIT